MDSEVQWALQMKYASSSKCHGKPIMACGWKSSRWYTSNNSIRRTRDHTGMRWSNRLCAVTRDAEHQAEQQPLASRQAGDHPHCTRRRGWHGHRWMVYARRRPRTSGDEERRGIVCITSNARYSCFAFKIISVEQKSHMVTAAPYVHEITFFSKDVTRYSMTNI
jgi:hypothetical protein